MDFVLRKVHYKDEMSAIIVYEFDRYYAPYCSFAQVLWPVMDQMDLGPTEAMAAAVKWQWSWHESTEPFATPTPKLEATVRIWVLKNSLRRWPGQ